VYAGEEECDDANAVDGDGCSPECELEGDCADANGDGNVSASDARIVLLRSTDALVECPAVACDVNASGRIDATDALATLRFAIGLQDAQVCSRPTRIIFRLEDAVALGALQFRVSYRGMPGAFLGEADRIQCTALVDVLSSFNHFSTGQTLTAGIIALAGMTGPVDIASCVFLRYGPRSELSFDVVVEDAAAPDLEPVTGITISAEER
jgi:cysteine-rich repeat protein